MIRSAFLGGLLVAVLLAAWPAAASTEFLAYEGRDAIHEGQGGDKKVVDGVDFWVDGSPPQRFQVLGAITDERWKSGLYGLMQISRLQHDIAKEVLTVGGDGVIITDAEDHIWGYGTSTFGSANYGNGWAYGSSHSVTQPYGTHATRYIVVKYLPEEPSPPAAAQAAIGSGAPPPQPPAQLPQSIYRPAQQPAVSQSSVTQVALESEGGIMVVPVTINGTIQLKFAVDSGASDVSIPADVFLTLVRAGTIDATDYIGTETYRLADGSTVPSERFRIRTLRVGDREIDDVTASIANPRGELLLGQSFLRRFTSWSIDNRREVLVLGDLPAPATAQANSVSDACKHPANGPRTEYDPDALRAVCYNGPASAAVAGQGSR